MLNVEWLMLNQSFVNIVNTIKHSTLKINNFHNQTDFTTYYLFQFGGKFIHRDDVLGCF